MTDYPTVWLAEDGYVETDSDWSADCTECRVVPVDVLRRIATAMRDGRWTANASMGEALDCLAILDTLTGDDDD